MKIGFFDSGLGGITILRSTLRQLPYYDYVYYGDTANVPYGDKSEEEIVELTERGLQFLFDNDVVLGVVACNTASAETLRKLQDTFLAGDYPDRRVLGVIIPTIEELIESGARRALLIGTKRTIDSHKYQQELKKRNITDIQFSAIATPTLVLKIEAQKVEDALKDCTEAIESRVGEIDTLVLGCTHYTELKKGLRELYGKRLMIMSQDEIIPRKLTEYLLRHPEIENQLSRGETCAIHLTKHSEEYDRIVQEF